MNQNEPKKIETPKPKVDVAKLEASKALKATLTANNQIVTKDGKS